MKTSEGDHSPDHQEIIRVTAKLHADHQKGATGLQQAVDRIVDLLGRPLNISLLVLTFLGWMGANLLLPMVGYPPIDPPPFPWLELVVSFAAFCVTILILATQKRDDQLAELREEMTLDLAILAEQKLAKIIELLEESRRDNPLLDDRLDPLAEAMASPSDPHAVRAAARRGTGRD